ncbi:MAG: hypothetical protein ACTH2Q_00515 [Propionibacteriaceae bacterium]
MQKVIKERRHARFLLIRHKYKTVAKFVGSRADWWAECDLFGCARDRKMLVLSIEQQYAEWLRTPQSRRPVPPREQVFAQIYAEFAGSVRRYMKSRQNLGADYVLFKCPHDPEVLTKRMQQQYARWLKSLPKNRGSVLVADGRVLVDDGSLSPGWRSSSVRTVSGGLPSLRRRR